MLLWILSLLFVFSGQVSTTVIGTNAFQEADTVGITKPCTKGNWLVKDVNDLAEIIHEAFSLAQSGRPGPVLIDIPKDVQFASGFYRAPQVQELLHSFPSLKGNNREAIEAGVSLLVEAKRPVIYSGGGVISSGGRLFSSCVI